LVSKYAPDSLDPFSCLCFIKNKFTEYLPILQEYVTEKKLTKNDVFSQIEKEKQHNTFYWNIVAFIVLNFGALFIIEFFSGWFIWIPLVTRLLDKLNTNQAL
jgi:hypothetical protein